MMVVKFLSLYILQDVKSDGHDADDPISDAVIAEIEAGIYGLQVLILENRSIIHGLK